jgi:hypothetical protein
MAGTVHFDRNVAFHLENLRYLFYSKNIRETFESLATGMTNAIRADADASNASAARRESATIVALYVTLWPWIALPGLLNLLPYAIVLLGHQRTSRSGAPVWKSCSIAVLSSGTTMREHLRFLGEPPTTTGLHERARGLYAELLRERASRDIELRWRSTGDGCSLLEPEGEERTRHAS